jgi:CheY-like chemotaxis protein
MRILLAIDDDPLRYQYLSRLLAKHDVVVAVVQNPDAADMLLDSKAVFAVMLDHDMPGWTGQHYAREVLGPRNIPVCISSANPAGARACSDILNEFAVPHTVISVVETAADERWLGWILHELYKRQ